jgi:ribonuclease BN (tRNA processing enzyme)
MASVSNHFREIAARGAQQRCPVCRAACARMTGSRGTSVVQPQERGESVGLLVVLGSGGWIPEEGRMTTCLAYRMDGSLFLFDAGSGMARLGREPFDRLVPTNGGRIHLFLSHLHIDHTVGLTYLPALWENPTVIHMPPASVLGVGPTALDALLGGPFFPLGIEEIHRDVAVETLPLGGTTIEGIRIDIRAQQHPGGSVGFRLADHFALMTDTTFDGSAADWARGVKVLVHESWAADCSSADAQVDLNGHSAACDAARLAREAGVEELILCHLPPFKEPAFYESMLQAARAVFPETSLALDGLTREL